MTDRTPTLLKLIEPHLPKATATDEKMPGGVELYLNNREYRLLLRTLRKALRPSGKPGA